MSLFSGLIFRDQINKSPDSSLKAQNYADQGNPTQILSPCEFYVSDSKFPLPHQSLHPHLLLRWLQSHCHLLFLLHHQVPIQSGSTLHRQGLYASSPVGDLAQVFISMLLPSLEFRLFIDFLPNPRFIFQRAAPFLLV